MKKLSRFLVLLFAALFLFAGCAKKEANVWSTARYTADTVLGQGSIAFTLAVTAEEKTVTFSLHSDKETLGDALLELGLIEGEEGPYGLYVKQVNGITADYDTDQTYWSLYVNGEYGMSGVDSTILTEGDTYGLIRTR